MAQIHSAKHMTEKAHWKEKEVDLGKQWNARGSLYEPRLQPLMQATVTGFPIPRWKPSFLIRLRFPAS